MLLRFKPESECQRVWRQVLKAWRWVMTDNYAALRSISLGGDMSMGKEKAHG